MSSRVKLKRIEKTTRDEMMKQKLLVFIKRLEKNTDGTDERQKRK
jgi:hypothetical protein